MDLGEKRAAGRHAHGFRHSRPQKLRRQTGVLRWRHPDVEARGDRGWPRRQCRRHGPREAIAPIGAGIDSADQQQDRQQSPQPPRIARREPGMRDADPQPAGRQLHTPEMRLPQTGRLRVERPAWPISECLQRPVLKTARLLDATAGGDGIGDEERTECRSQSDHEGDAEAQQNAGMQPARKIR